MVFDIAQLYYFIIKWEYKMETNYKNVVVWVKTDDQIVDLSLIKTTLEIFNTE